MIPRFILFPVIFVLAVTTAYAARPQFIYRYRPVSDSDPSVCSYVRASCDGIQNYQCNVLTGTGVRVAWDNSACTLVVFHSSSVPLLPL